MELEVSRFNSVTTTALCFVETYPPASSRVNDLCIHQLSLVKIPSVLKMA